LGRVVAGLPQYKPEFAVLPPHFDASHDELVSATIAHMFPMLSQDQQLRGVLHLCLASLVYHSNALRRTLPPTHQLLHAYVFRELTTMHRLRQVVTLNESVALRPIGTPPHIEMYQRQMTRPSSFNHQAADDIRVVATATVVEEVPASASATPFTLHTWGGGLHKLPEDFTFPRVDVLVEWKLWWFGNKERSTAHPTNPLMPAILLL
ncbi:TPA: hypothetical protein N0F65_005416, partial [Lagenidium giganteum]